MGRTMLVGWGKTIGGGATSRGGGREVHCGPMMQTLTCPALQLIASSRRNSKLCVIALCYLSLSPCVYVSVCVHHRSLFLFLCHLTAWERRYPALFHSRENTTLRLLAQHMHQ